MGLSCIVRVEGAIAKTSAYDYVLVHFYIYALGAPHLCSRVPFVLEF